MHALALTSRMAFLPRAPRALRALRALAGATLLLVASAAHAVPQCTVAASATLSFGAVVALASTGDVTSDTGTSFWVNCNAEVTGAPAIYSSSPRAMAGAARNLPFSLSLAAPGGTPLPTASPGTPLAIPRNGTNQAVVLYGRLRNVDFRSLPAGLYSTSVVVTVEY